MHAAVAGRGVGRLHQGLELGEVPLGLEHVGAVAPVVGGGEEVHACGLGGDVGVVGI